MKVNEVLKSQLLHRKPMKARFKLPMKSELAAQYLTAAISAEVEYRNNPFRNGSELHKQKRMTLCPLETLIARLFRHVLSENQTLI